MWQRARLLVADPTGAAPAGFLFWVECAPPAAIVTTSRSRSGAWTMPARTAPRYRTNLIHPDRPPWTDPEAFVAADAVELLPEFCENPERVPCPRPPPPMPLDD